jgi:hypothetical protein
MILLKASQKVKYAALSNQRKLHLIVMIGLVQLTAAAQQNSPTVAAKPDEYLKIYVLEGQGAINSIPQRRVTIPVVEVRDENDLPVEAAEVIFELPERGPGGTFAAGKRIHTARTNLQGQANAPFFINTVAGSFVMSVSARKLARSGQAAIEQTNSPLPLEEAMKPKQPWYKSWKILTLLGAAATAGGAIALTQGGNSGGGPGAAIPTIAISPGSPTFGGPR